jgi:glycosyltransferase involved in cell wall biosynthesis
VFSLDPYFTAYAATRYGSSKVVTLPDPYYPPGSGTSPAILHDPPPPDRITFLLFGVLTDRKKGVAELLQALRGLAPEAARRIAIRIAGRIDPPVAEQVQQLADAVQAERPELWLRIEGRHLSSRELAQAIAASQVVLITYQRSIGSSGALVWAAREGKPVIAQEYGLLGRFVRDYRLGITVRTDDPAAMARGIETVVREGVDSIADPAGMRNFLAGREPERFARIIVDTILGIRPQEDEACASPITVAQGSS